MRFLVEASEYYTVEVVKDIDQGSTDDQNRLLLIKETNNWNMFAEKFRINNNEMYNFEMLNLSISIVQSFILIPVLSTWSTQG